MKAYLLVTAILFALAALTRIGATTEPQDAFAAVVLSALSAWGFYLWFNL